MLRRELDLALLVTEHARLGGVIRLELRRRHPQLGALGQLSHTASQQRLGIIRGLREKEDQRGTSGDKRHDGPDGGMAVLVKMQHGCRNRRIMALCSSSLLSPINPPHVSTIHVHKKRKRPQKALNWGVPEHILDGSEQITWQTGLNQTALNRYFLPNRHHESVTTSLMKGLAVLPSCLLQTPTCSLAASSQISSLLGHNSQPCMMSFRASANFP
ncbi:hypothetical protein Vretimale_16636, partial [Volvox reticuliferus]